MKLTYLYDALRIKTISAKHSNENFNRKESKSEKTKKVIS